MSVISCKNVYLSYDNVSVINDLNFELCEGNYLCIVGENGSGKSTLIKALLGLKQTASGHLHIAGGINGKGIGYLPQQTTSQKDFPASVYEVVLSGCIAGKKGVFFSREHKQNAVENMKKLDIYHLRKKCYRELSGGQQQRVLLARALCAGKKMLLLDEPVTGLDPIVTNDFYNVINKLNKQMGVTVVMVSHDLLSAVEYATHILHLKKDGSFFGTVDEYRSSDIFKLYQRREEI